MATAHTLRGSSGSVGAVDVAESCRIAEALPATVSRSERLAAVDRVGIAVERVGPALLEVTKAVPAAG